MTEVEDGRASHPHGGRMPGLGAHVPISKSDDLQPIKALIRVAAFPHVRARPVSHQHSEIPESSESLLLSPFVLEQ